MADDAPRAWVCDDCHRRVRTIFRAGPKSRCFDCHAGYTRRKWFAQNPTPKLTALGRILQEIEDEQLDPDQTTLDDWV